MKIDLAEEFMKNTCSICNKKRFCKELCVAHYRRLQRHGSPTGGGSARQKRGNPVRAFYALIKRTNTCWLWKGRTNKGGYGILSVHGKETLAHRFSYFIAFGAYPSNLCLHSCDVRNCVNPAHLRSGTHQDNNDDMMNRQRNRQLKGEAHPNSKLTTFDIRFIRFWVARGFGTSDLGRLFSIHPGAMTRIVHRQSWTHI